MWPNRLSISISTIGIALLLVLPALLPSPNPDDSPRKDRLIAIESMDKPRASHTMTTLNDGRVLVVGGMTAGEDAPAGVTLFDPSTDRFTPLKDRSTDGSIMLRHSHVSALLDDGRVLIAGGYGAGNRLLTSASIFNPADNSFTLTGDLPEPSADQTSTRLADGRVLLIGGMTADWRFLSSVVLYDPSTASFTTAGELNVARASHTATLLPDGTVLIAGGHTGRRGALTILQSTEIFDPATGTATLKGDMRIRRHKHDAVALASGNVLIVGGADERDSGGTYNSTEIYDLETGSFKSHITLAYKRYKLRGTTLALSADKVLVAGGAERPEVLFTGQNRTFPVHATDDLAGQFSAASLLPDGRVLITGGYGPRIRPTNKAWIFVPAK